MGLLRSRRCRCFLVALLLVCCGSRNTTGRSDHVRGIDDTPPYVYNFTAPPFAAPPVVPLLLTSGQAAAADPKSGHHRQPDEDQIHQSEHH